jgi:hypothetical protein
LQDGCLPPFGSFTHLVFEIENFLPVPGCEEGTVEAQPVVDLKLPAAEDDANILVAKYPPVFKS